MMITGIKCLGKIPLANTRQDKHISLAGESQFKRSGRLLSSYYAVRRIIHQRFKSVEGSGWHPLF